MYEVYGFVINCYAQKFTWPKVKLNPYGEHHCDLSIDAVVHFEEGKAREILEKDAPGQNWKIARWIKFSESCNNMDTKLKDLWRRS